MDCLQDRACSRSDLTADEPKGGANRLSDLAARQAASSVLMDRLKDLNEQQRQAVSAPLGPVLVLAGPGSGKTRVLTHRIAYLIDHFDVRPSEIIAMTFTNKAAREMRSRVDALLEDSPGSALGVSLGTFHALSARILRREADRLPFTRSFVIFDESDQQALMRQVIKELNLDAKQATPGRILGTISSAKNELIDQDTFAAGSYFGEIVRRAYQRYQELLLQNNALDFDDILFWVVKLLRDDQDLQAGYRKRYPHVLIDEFQDTNTAQYVLLRLLSRDDSDLFVVGDADQAIYRWRGADYRNVLRLQEDYPQVRVILLEQNYRSTQTILDAAMGVIDRLPARRKKRLFTDRGRGDPIAVHEAFNEADEALFVVDKIAELTFTDEAEPGDCAVMYRTNAQSRALEEAFFKAGVPYRLLGAQRFYGRREVKDVVGYLRLIHNPADQVSLLRVLNVPSRGIGSKTVETLLQTAAMGKITPAEVLLDLAKGSESKHAGAFAARQTKALGEFGRLLTDWIEIKEQLSVAELIDRVLADVDYREYLEASGEEGQDRWANVLELRGVAEEITELDLTTFLEHVALVSDQDTLTEGLNAPILLTLHAAKGLEFKVVFIIGLDDGVLPHQRSFDDAEAMAEERRLFYVGVTRAEDQLFLLRAFRRRLAGVSLVNEPSRFLMDIPADLLEGDLVGHRTAAQASFARQTRWEDPRPSSKEVRFRVGMRVKHRSFGEGIVVEAQMVGGDEEITVNFESAGMKRLLAGFAALEVLEG
jgi:DNA helicase-2/ATP-dependent DNA helicase PcrA